MKYLKRLDHSMFIIYVVFFFLLLKDLSDTLKSLMPFLYPDLGTERPALYSWLKSELWNNHTNHFSALQLAYLSPPL